jgi:hypothetical protein
VRAWQSLRITLLKGEPMEIIAEGRLAGPAEIEYVIYRIG